jgi:hypothetical protein
MSISKEPELYPFNSLSHPSPPIISDDEYRWELDILKIIDENMDWVTPLVETNISDPKKQFDDFKEQEYIKDEPEIKETTSSAFCDYIKPTDFEEDEVDEDEVDEDEVDEDEVDEADEEAETEEEDEEGYLEFKILENMSSLVQCMLVISREIKSIKTQMNEIKENTDMLLLRST